LVSFPIEKFPAVWERTTISKNILENGFIYTLSFFMWYRGFWSENRKKYRLRKEFFLPPIGYIWYKNGEFYVNGKNVDMPF
jgi:hypothetical protein